MFVEKDSITIINNFFKQYGFSSDIKPEHQFYKLKKIYDFVNLNDFKIDNDNSMKRFQNVFLRFFYRYDMYHFENLFSNIKYTSTEEKEKLTFIFNCVIIEYSGTKEDFILSIDNLCFELDTFPIIMENKMILKLISEELYIKSIFMNEQKIHKVIKNKLLEISKIAFNQINLVEKIEKEFTKTIFEFMKENKVEIIKKITVLEKKEKDYFMGIKH